MTARDLIKGSLRLLGVLASGEEPTAAEAADALTSLNSLIDTWRTERLMVYAITPESFSLVANQKVYTMGPGGNFDTVRPQNIDMVQMIYTGSGTPQPLNLPIQIINRDQYNAFVVPDTASSIPLWVYVDDSFPQRKLYFYTVPTEAYAVEIFTWKLLGAIANLNADISFPPGYERALRFNLALELAPEFGMSPSQVVIANAMEAKAAVKSLNNQSASDLLMQSDSALIAGVKSAFNWLTGQSGPARS